MNTPMYADMVDPRGPWRKITDAPSDPRTNHLVTLECGHKPEFNQHFHYAVGSLVHCFACGQLPYVAPK